MEKLVTVRRGAIEGETIYFALEICCNCYMPFLMPKSFQKEALDNPNIWFYCPAGHGQHYNGPTEAQKLKKLLEQKQKEFDEQIQQSTNRFLDEVNERKRIERKLKRVHNGVCPCCNRSFSNLEQHMKNKHPDVEAPSNVSKPGNLVHAKINKKVKKEIAPIKWEKP